MSNQPAAVEAPAEGASPGRWRPSAVLLFPLHIGVSWVAWAAQGRFYEQLGSPGNIGYRLIGVAVQPGTLLITAVVATSALIVSWIVRRHRMFVLPAVAIAGVAVVGALLSQAAGREASRVEAGRPQCRQSILAPMDLCARMATVAGVSGFDMAWLPGRQAIYLGDWHLFYVLINPATHHSFLVSNQNVSLAWQIK